MLYKRLIPLITLLVVVALAVSLTPAVSVRAQAKELKGDLNVFLQTYYNPATDKDTAAVAEAIAKEYMDKHPGVNIKLVPDLPAGQDYETFLAPRMAPDQAPDIIWQQFGTPNQPGINWFFPL